MNSDRRAAALFKKEQQARESQQARAHYQAELYATREKTARLRALRLARDAANQGGLPAGQKDAAQLAKQRVAKKGARQGQAPTAQDHINVLAMAASRGPRSAFPWFESYQAASVSLQDHVWMTGWRLTSSIPAMMRSLSSCFDATRM